LTLALMRDLREHRAARAAALTVFLQFLELRHRVELHNLTGRMVECPLDELNRPRASVDPQLRIPPTEAEIEQLFAGWRTEPVTCRKFAPPARNDAAARLAADVGLRINDARMLDLDDVRWELGRFGKLKRPPRQGLTSARSRRADRRHWRGSPHRHAPPAHRPVPATPVSRRACPHGGSPLPVDAR
jgi:integrase